MFTVLSPGPRSLFQDRGRTGYEQLGVPTSGAADLASHDLANALVGNSPDAATVEIMLGGVELLCEADSVVALTGAEADLRIEGRIAPLNHSVHVRSGQRLHVGFQRNGVYSYLSVAGGFEPSPVLGSRSFCTLSGLGPAPLETGAVLTTGTTQAKAQACRRRVATGDVFRFFPGPHASLLGSGAMTVFTGSRWTVSANVSRVGYRLTGAAVPVPALDLGSMGMVTGAVQVPPDGHPVVLGPDHGTTGGYPVLGVIVPDDLSRLMQRRPGQHVRFAPVSTAADEPVWASQSPRPTVIDLDALIG